MTNQRSDFISYSLLLTTLCLLLLNSGCVGKESRDTDGDRPVNSTYGPTQQADVAYKWQNFNEAFELLEPQAISGDADAQYFLGYLYFYGEGVNHDEQKAWKWIERSAQQNNAKAMMALQLRDTQGLVAQSTKEATTDPESAVDLSMMEVATRADAKLNVRSAPGPESMAVANHRANKLQTAMADPVLIPAQPRTEPLLETEKASGTVTDTAQDETQPAQGSESVNSWVKARNPDHYTIQVISLRRAQALQKYLAGQSFDRSVGAIRYNTNNRPTHALVYGEFSSYQAAQQAMNSLDDTLLRNGPWIRRFGEIQALLADSPARLKSLASHRAAEPAPFSSDSAPVPVLQQSMPQSATEKAPSVSIESNRNETNYAIESLQKKSWIMERDPDHYTIQLISLSRARALQQYLAGQSFSYPVESLSYKVNRQTRHALVYGDFGGYQTAQQALNTLDESLRKHGPWIRRFGDIQALARQ